MDEIEKIFSNENNHLYGRIDIDYMSVSGCGSQLDESTKNIRNNLYDFLIKYNIQSIFDSPCGDFWWMKYIDFKDIRYIGGDIITNQIKKLNMLYPNINFIRFDLTKDVLPDVDLLFCRDCLFHLSDDYKKMVFNNFINSNIKYILMSNHPLSNNNLNINTGDFSHVNWQLSPWNFLKPIDIMYDSNIGYDTKEMQLYSREQILKFLSKKVSFVCTTFRRFYCVRRIVAQYKAQTYKNKELIIFNTDVEFPYELGFEDDSITIINNSIDYVTNLPYTNRGDICRDAVTHSTGDYFMLADDDDIYLPWHLQQAVDGIEEIKNDAWKPEQSFFATPDKLMLCRNTMEASVIVKMNRIKEIGFRADLTGYEGLSWYTKLRDENQLNEHNKKYLPSYCFNWSDPEKAGHKQSGDIDNPNNFENHKNASKDIVTSLLTPLDNDELNMSYQRYYDFIKNNKELFDREMYNKYLK